MRIRKRSLLIPFIGNFVRFVEHEKQTLTQNTKMKKLIVFTTLTFFSVITYGQSNPDELITTFFKEYAKSPVKAVENLYATSVWTSRNKDGIETIKNEIAKLNVDFVGKYYGYEPIIKKQFSESFLLSSYMVKYDRQPLRFTFELYKPNDKWVLFSFKFDTDLDDEIEEAAKLYHLNLEK